MLNKLKGKIESIPLPFQNAALWFVNGLLFGYLIFVKLPQLQAFLATQ
jgi:hypothetical protein